MLDINIKVDGNDYFRYGEVNVKSTEKITLSKNYIEERILSHVR